LEWSTSKSCSNQSETEEAGSFAEERGESVADPMASCTLTLPTVPAEPLRTISTVCARRVTVAKYAKGEIGKDSEASFIPSIPSFLP
jgi:hypothetical protein